MTKRLDTITKKVRCGRESNPGLWQGSLKPSPLGHGGSCVELKESGVDIEQNAR